MAKTSDIRTNFNDKLVKFLSDHPENRARNIRLFTKVRYDELIREMKEIKQLRQKTKKGMKPQQYRRLHRYDLKLEGGTEKLIENKKNEGTGRYFCHTEDLFDILHESHVNSGHKKTRVMERQIKKQYCNVTREIIDIYLSLCKICHQKKQDANTKFIVKSRIVNSCCYFEIINMQTQPDGQYQFILYYQDHLTKFIILRSLKTMTPYDVANELMDIFCIFGTPCILRSDSGQHYVRTVIQSLGQIKQGTKLVYGNSGQSQNQCLQEIRGKVMNWMSEEKTGNWSRGLRFVQLSYNRCHNTTSSTPYEAMFGNMHRVGLEDCSLPLHEYNRLETEADLEKAIDNWNDQNEVTELEVEESSPEEPKRKKSGKKTTAQRTKKPKEAHQNDMISIPEGNLRSEIESVQQQFYATNALPGCFRRNDYAPPAPSTAFHTFH